MIVMKQLQNQWDSESLTLKFKLNDVDDFAEV